MKTLFFHLSLLVLFLVGCSPAEEVQPVPEPIQSVNGCSDNAAVLFCNSFESETDLETFPLGAFELTDDAPEIGGEKSLVINGGCVLPHFYFNLGPFEEGATLSLTCFGKQPEDSSLEGYLSVSTFGTSNPEILFEQSIDALEWTAYSGEFEVAAGDQIQLNIVSGGIVSAVTFVDVLKIEVME